MRLDVSTQCTLTRAYSCRVRCPMQLVSRLPVAAPTVGDCLRVALEIRLHDPAVAGHW